MTIPRFLRAKASFLPPLFIVLVVATLFITNFKSGTYLTGWDNLQSELNLSLNIKRSFFAVWQEYQGLGLLGGMAHSADLLHQLILVPLSVLLPQELVRYTWTMFALLVGGLGAYQLSLTLLNKKHPSLTTRFFACLAGTFYILNLSTLQSFYIPFETFTNHFAILPWILWAAMQFLATPNKRTLGVLFLVSILATPSYYVPTLFLVTLFSLGILSLVSFLSKRSLPSFLSITKLFLITFVVNAFWLLPFLYFTATNAHVVPEAKINQMATQTIFLENKQFGTIQDVALLKGFWFEKIDPDLSGSFSFLMGIWRPYVQSWPFLIFAYSLFVLILLGFFVSIKSRNIKQISIAALFGFAFTMLMVNTPPFSWIVLLFRNGLPLFDQAFRFPFTKFSILTSLTYSLLFANGLYWLSQKVPVKLRSYRWILAVSFLVLIPVSLFPLFRSGLFYQREQVVIPKDYVQVFEFFKKQNKSTRIANFPQTNFWSWNYFRWGYGGSGFYWYGIEQPILDRAFDPWSNYNENYYWEVSYALYSKNPQLLNAVFEKYQVNWVFIDKNVFSTTNQKSLYFDELENLLAQMPDASLAKEVGNIKIYQLNLQTPVNNFVFSAKNLPVVEKNYDWGNKDTAYSKNDAYTTPNSTTSDSLYYPFRSLFTGRNADDARPFTIREDSQNYFFETVVPANIADKSVNAIVEDKELVHLDPSDLKTPTYLTPQLAIEPEKVIITVPKAGGYLSAEINPDPSNMVISCDQEAKGIGEHTVNTSSETSTIELLSKGTTCRISVWLPNLQHNLSYLVSIESKNKTGQPLVYWIENPISRKADSETYLPKGKYSKTSYFVQPPMAEDGVGYTLHIDNRSNGKDLTINELGKITVQPLPYHYLTTLSFGEINKTKAELQKLIVSHPNPSLYSIELASQESQTIVLSQAFNSGWQAYTKNTNWPTFFLPLTGTRIPQHILINNWENGWEVQNPQSSKIVLIYLPQYLEYAGFALLFGSSLYILVTSVIIGKNDRRRIKKESNRRS